MTNSVAAHCSAADAVCSVDGLVGTGTGTVLWQLAAPMAVFNLAGGMLGAHPALKRGSGFVRVVLLTVVFALVANLAHQQRLT